MKPSVIQWIVYDGSAATRPHSIRKDFSDADERQREKMEIVYLLQRADGDWVENQGFHFKPTFRWDEKGKQRFSEWQQCLNL